DRGKGHDQRLLGPFGEDGALGGADAHDYRQGADLAIDVQPRYPVEDRRELEDPRPGRRKELEQGGFANVAPGVLLAERLSRDHRAVGHHEGDRAVGSRVDAVVQLAEEVDLHGADDDPGEAAVRMLQPPAEAELPGVIDTTEKGMADEQADVGPIAVNG